MMLYHVGLVEHACDGCFPFASRKPLLLMCDCMFGSYALLQQHCICIYWWGVALVQYCSGS
jgi:hypothetical protein